jgi:hypothetical protein
MNWRFVLLPLILAWASVSPAVAASAVPPARDLRGAAEQAARSGQVVLVVFTLYDCPYCQVAMNDYLGPMAADPAYRAKVRILEVKMDEPTPLTDFAGRASTHEKFAHAQQVRVAPTVKVFLPNGEPGAEPVVGLTLPDFYGAYVNQAIDTALERSHRAAR